MRSMVDTHTPPRRTIGTLMARITEAWGRLPWLGLDDAARQADVNLVCYIGRELSSPHGFEPLREEISGALKTALLLRQIGQQQEELRAAFDRERALDDTVRELGSPVIPLIPGVLLVPLVGSLDPARAQQVVEAVLSGIAEHQAETVLLDITGVPLVDTQVAHALLQTARAAGLLGAQVTLVGIRPEIAQSIIGLGVDLGDLATAASLAAAIEELRCQAGT
ncbi:MAG: hypothetical protein RLZZ387_4336 [Chloroflexota bacterium]